MSSMQSFPFIKANKVKKLFKDVSEEYDLVYFGNVSQHSDEHQMVRGFTLSPSHVDRHYCVGTVSGRDVILLERTDTISFPDRPSKAYTWVILQVDLTVKSPLHVMLNSFHYEEPVYATLFTKLHHLHKFDAAALSHLDKAFTRAFTVYAALQYIDRLSEVIGIDTASVMGHHFKGLDYEIIEDELIVYVPAVTPTHRDIDHLFKAGVWLAGEIEKSLRLGDSSTAIAE
jgi:hypothetical protein